MGTRSEIAAVVSRLFGRVLGPVGALRTLRELRRVERATGLEFSYVEPPEGEPDEEGGSP